MQQFYSDIFYENLGQSVVVPAGHSITYEAMVWFGGYDLTVPVILAIAGAVIGCFLNWGLGYILGSIRELNNRFLSDDKHKHLSGLARKYGIFLLPFFWIPLGGLLVVGAGFFGVRWWIMLPMVLIGSAAYYALGLNL